MYKCLTQDEFKPKAKLTIFGSIPIVPFGSSYLVKYNVKDNNPFVDKELHETIVPCVRCSIMNVDTLSVLQGVKSCPNNWDIVYEGYVMSANWNHVRTENICVDTKASSSLTVGDKKHTSMISPIEATCDGKPCGSNRDSSAVRCVVCIRKATI